ncbi:hypothetical protein CPB84DRAFT_1845856 [Gymnopilus junonius]|uniref:NADH:flavin oxidoreductase/NADH oxidase N-terminal domain-containing protein n=1 Tax=Gymnopilus junonius TaxID=109634 RepID=A0A9P5NNR3_GYMJU|nr:hypothetical protein CPB84DRAFT_1845856 [Gymnopilus junonius]
MPFKALFKPLQLCDITLRNRIGMSALTRDRAEDTYPTELMKEYYVQRAVGRAGLIVTEGILVSRHGIPWLHVPGIWDDKHVAGWKAITEAVHAVGGKIYAQLAHVGRLSHPEDPQQKLSGLPVYAPSAIPIRGMKYRHISGSSGIPIPTAVEDPRLLIEQFKHAAYNAKRAGFDGVELHGASGMLVAQFLDHSSNQRTDEWGGSVENRARFGLEVLKAMTEVYGHNVAVKVNPAGGANDMGMPLQDTLDTFSYFLSEADKLRLSYIVISRHNPKFDTVIDGIPRGTPHNELEAYRPFVKHSSLFLNGGVTPEEAESLTSQGKIDGVFFGIGWISHPDLTKRIEYGLPLDTPPSVAHLYSPKEGEDWSIGYTDYPIAAR